MAYSIGLPNGKRCSVGTYVRSWRALKAIPPDAKVRGWDWYAVPAREILRELRRGLHDRINRHVPEYGKGRKWSSDWFMAAWRLSRDVNRPRLIVHYCPPDFRARLAHRVQSCAR